MRSRRAPRLAFCLIYDFFTGGGEALARAEFAGAPTAMKGIVFTEFLDMVEARFGLAALDQIIERSDLPSGGAYTAVGTYDHQELVALVGTLASITRTPVPDLLRTYGRHLFGRFAERFPRFFPAEIDCFQFLSGIDSYIHVEVRKLYPDAELPQFDVGRPAENELSLTYRSCRPFGVFAEGLIQGCIEHFGEKIAVDVRPPPADAGAGAGLEFRLVRQAA
jgi:hypothetical protein